MSSFRVSVLRKPSFWIFSAFGLCWLGIALTRARYETDTQAIIDGGAQAWRCLVEGRFTSCEGVRDFAFLQYAVSIPGAALGISPRVLMRVYEVISMISVVAMLGMTWNEFRRRGAPAVGWLGIAILLTGPFLHYFRSTSGEALASALILAGVCATVRSRRESVSPVLILLLSFFSTLTKEVAFPFLLLLSLLGRRKSATALGVALGWALSALFNLFRFGVFWNTYNLSDRLRVHDPLQRLSGAAAIWLSPSGGLVFFWPVFVALLGVGLVLSVKDRAPALEGERLSWVAGALLTLAGMTVGLSGWYAPLGWVGWGPRLILPWVPAGIYLLLMAVGAQSVSGLYALAGRAWAKIAFFLGVFLVSAPQSLILLAPWVLGDFFQRTNPGCPRIPTVDDGALYFRCLNYLFWEHSPLVLDAWSALRKPMAWVFLSLHGAVLWMILERVLKGSSPECSAATPAPSRSDRSWD